MLYMLKSLVRHSALLKDLVARDLKARYVGSSMGFFWSILFPLINLLVFTFVFRVILNARWGDEQGALEVSLVMLAGIIVWTAFAESLSRSTNCLVDNSNLIKKVVFPSQILPAYLTFSAVINMCIGLPIVLGAVVWFGFLSPPQAAIEREHAFAEVWEGYDPGAEGATPPPRVFVSTERSWHSSTRYRLEYTGTATRGVDYAAPTDLVELPADRSRIYVPIIPLRDAEAEGDGAAARAGVYSFLDSDDEESKSPVSPPASGSRGRTMGAGGGSGMGGCCYLFHDYYFHNDCCFC